MYSVHLIDCQEVDLRFLDMAVLLISIHIYMNYFYYPTHNLCVFHMDLYYLFIDHLISEPNFSFRQNKTCCLVVEFCGGKLAVSKTHINIFPNFLRTPNDFLVYHFYFEWTIVLWFIIFFKNEF